MGVALAWPQDKYDLVTIDCARLSDDVQEAKQKWEKREEITGIRKLASNLKTRLKNVVSALTSSLEYERPPFDGWKEARKKHNVLVTATLQPKKGGDAFCVGTYHMPCLFGSVDKERVMVIHASLAAARVKKVADGKRYVLCGDFNVKPYDACYQLLTQGSLSGEFADRTPSKPDGDVVAGKFSSTVEPPLKSAYVLANGKEPDFTNFAYTKPMGADMDAFVETLADETRRAALRTIAASLKSDAVPVLFPPACPCTVMWGASDAIVPPPNVPTKGLRMLPNVGHLPHVEAVSEVASAVKELLDGAFPPSDAWI